MGSVIMFSTPCDATISITGVTMCLLVSKRAAYTSGIEFEAENGLGKSKRNTLQDEFVVQGQRVSSMSTRNDSFAGRGETAGGESFEQPPVASTQIMRAPSKKCIKSVMLRL